MKSTSYHSDLSNEAVERILSENGFEESGLIVNDLSYRKTGYGHWKLEANIIRTADLYDNLYLNVTTTNSSLIDDWNEDECYFQDDNSGHWFDSNGKVMEAALDYIISSEANQELISEFINA